jgi:hypothetical protein
MLVVLAALLLLALSTPARPRVRLSPLASRFQGEA